MVGAGSSEDRLTPVTKDLPCKGEGFMTIFELANCGWHGKRGKYDRTGI